MKSTPLFLAFALFLNVLPLGAGAQEKPMKAASAEATTTEAQPDSSQARVAKFSGRLPRFFSAVIDPEQRIAIYDIQRSYYEQKQRLIQELDDVKRSEMEEIEDVLTTAQRKEIEELRMAASTRSNAPRPTSAKSSSTKSSSENASPEKAAPAKSTSAKSTSAKSSSKGSTGKTSASRRKSAEEEMPDESDTDRE